MLRNMAGILDNFRCPTCECECIDLGDNRNAVASVTAGALVRLYMFFFPNLTGTLNKPIVHTNFFM